MNDDIQPSSTELEFLQLAYSKFFMIFETIFDDSFWDWEAKDRFLRIAQGFAIYTELLNYPPIGWYLKQLKMNRPPMEAEIAEELFKFVRNVIAHFPFYETWDDIYVNKRLTNWHRDGQSIDRFLKRYQGREVVKYRFWEARVKRMTYLNVRFPNGYDAGGNIFLKDMLEEKTGVKFAFILMRQVLNSQIEPTSDGDDSAEVNEINKPFPTL